MTEQSRNPSSSPTQTLVAPEGSEQQQLKLSDTVIVMIRDILQVAILTGRDVTDMFRAMRLEVAEGTTNVLIPNPGYVESYNDMIKRIEADVDRVAAERLAEQDRALGVGKTPVTN